VYRIGDLRYSNTVTDVDFAIELLGPTISGDIVEDKGNVYREDMLKIVDPNSAWREEATFHKTSLLHVFSR